MLSGDQELFHPPSLGSHLLAVTMTSNQVFQVIKTVKKTNESYAFRPNLPLKFQQWGPLLVIKSSGEPALPRGQAVLLAKGKEVRQGKQESGSENLIGCSSASSHERGFNSRPLETCQDSVPCCRLQCLPVTVDCSSLCIDRSSVST